MVLLIPWLGVSAAVNLSHRTGAQREGLAAFPMRAAVLKAVAAEPGIIFSDLRERLHCGPGTLQHHVNLLERERFLVSVQAGRRRRLFLAGTPRDTRGGMDLLHSERTWQLIRSVLAQPGIVQKDIAIGMAISRKVLRSYLDRLAEQGLLREVPTGRFRSYYPSEGLFGLLARMPDRDEGAEPKGFLVPVVPETANDSAAPRALLPQLPQ